MNTEELIDTLARDAGPVRPLPAPARRVLGWLFVALGFAAAMVWAIGPTNATRLADWLWARISLSRMERLLPWWPRVASTRWK